MQERFLTVNGIHCTVAERRCRHISGKHANAVSQIDGTCQSLSPFDTFASQLDAGDIHAVAGRKITRRASETCAEISHLLARPKTGGFG